MKLEEIASFMVVIALFFILMKILKWSRSSTNTTYHDSHSHDSFDGDFGND